jgi:hypothetical protein
LSAVSIQADNWFLDQAGDLYLIDFEHSRIDLPVVILRFRVSRGCDLRHRDGVHRPFAAVAGEYVAPVMTSRLAKRTM